MMRPDHKDLSQRLSCAVPSVPLGARLNLGYPLQTGLGTLEKNAVTKLFFLTLTLLFSLAALGQLDYERHIVFDNSLTHGSYYYSVGSSVPPSELELDHLKIPVEENHSVTPPNSLRLKWSSKPGGDWKMVLYTRPRYSVSEFSGKNLFVWCYAPEGLPASASPRVYLNDTER